MANYPLNLANTETVIANSVHLLIGTEPTDLYDILLTLDGANTITGLDSITIQRLKDVADSAGTNPDIFDDISNQLALNTKTSEKYSRFYINDFN